MALEPFAEITTRVQSESLVTASLVVPSVVHLIDHLKNMKPHVSFLKNLCLQLEQSIHKRFSGIIKRLNQEPVSINDGFSDPIYFICTILDPSFKFYWISQLNLQSTMNVQLKQSLIQILLDECQLNTDHSLNNSQHATSYLASTSIKNSSTTQPIGNSVVKTRRLFHYDDQSAGTLDSALDPVDEIDTYLNDPLRTEFSLYWKNSQLRSLKLVVKRVFAVQATSAPIERAFSQAGIIMSPRRTSMKEETFRSLVFLRVNQIFL